MAGGLNLQPNFQKKRMGGGPWQDLNFERWVAGREGSDFFEEGWGKGGGCNFHIKKIKIWNI